MMNKEKKIAFLLPSNVAGGAERVMTSLANYISNNSSYNVCFIFFDKKNEFYSLNKEIEIINLGLDLKKINKTKKYLMFFTYIKKLKSCLKMVNPNIVVSFLFITNIIGVLCCKNLNIPIILAERNDPKHYSKKQKIIMKFMYRMSDGFVCQSKEISEYMVNKFKVKNSIIIPNPINGIQVGSYVENKNKKIISVGRLVKQKNHKLLIQAFSKIANDFPEYKLYIYGDGELRNDLNELIKFKGMENRIFLPGVIKDTIKINNDAQLFILSSDFEGFPNVLLEAMANGIPVIASNVFSGTVKMLIEDNKNGYLFEPGNENELTQVIEKALINTSKLNEFARINLDIPEKFSINNIANIWINYIEIFIN